MKIPKFVCSTLLCFVKFVSQLVKKAPAHFYPTLEVVICKNYVVRPLHSFNKCRKFLSSSLETFFCRNLENIGMSFLGQCNVEMVSCPGFYGLSCSKYHRFWGWFVPKKFNGCIFCFLGHIWWTAFWVICPWNEYEVSEQCAVVKPAMDFFQACISFRT